MPHQLATDVVLHRRRLLDLVAGHQGLVVVTASAGAGKSVLADQLGRAHPHRLIVDDAADWLRSANGDLPPDAIVFSRTHIEPGSEHGNGRLLQLTDADLWMTGNEIQELLDHKIGPDPGNSSAAEIILAGTRGWPAAVDAVVQALAHRPDAISRLKRFSTRGPHLWRVVDPLIASLPVACRDELAEVAHLRHQLPDFYQMLSCGQSLEELREHGFPYRYEADGSFAIPAAFLWRLKSHQELSTERGLSCGAIMVEELGLAEALTDLVEARCWDAVAELAIRHGLDAWLDADARLLAPLVEASSRLETNPQFLFVLVRVACRLTQFDVFHRYIDMCIDAARQSDDRLMALRGEMFKRVMAASAWMELPTDDELEMLAADHAEFGNDVSAAELLELQFVVASLQPRCTDKVEGISLGLKAAKAYENLGQGRAAVRVLSQTTNGPATDLGRFQLVSDLLDLVQEKVADDREPLWLLGQRATAFALIGDWRNQQQVMERAETLYGRHPYYNTYSGYLWGSRMLLAAQSGDSQGVQHAVQHVREGLLELRDGPTGTLWDSRAAECLVLVGQHQQAREMLDEVLPRRRYDAGAVGLAEVIVEARTGDPAVVDQLCRELVEQDLISMERRWRLDLERLAARQRMGHDVGRQLEATINDASRYGMEQMARRLAQTLSHSLSESGLASRKVPTGPEINVMGRFRVMVQGQEVPVPQGRPATLLKYLALRGGAAHVESVAEILWPGIDPTTGRRRIRNVLRRARTAVGDKMLRREGELILLDSSVTSDVDDFHRAVAASTSAPADSEDYLQSARRAVDFARRGLLPDDPFADWAADDRWHVESVGRRLVGELAVGPHHTPALTDWLIDAAVDIDVLDESVYISLARRGLDWKSQATVRRALEAAFRAAEKLQIDFQPPPDLEDLIPV